MDLAEFEMFQDQERSNWVRLRTLVVLRWIAIAGQTTALVVAVYSFGLRLETGLAAMTIGASVIANLFSTFLFPENRRLTERQAMLMMIFDILQLGLLLYLTGGLHNPFALLMLAPVTISATVLHLRSTLALGLVAVIIITLLTKFYLPIRRPSGEILELPDLFGFGFWLALVIGVVFLAVYARQVTNEMHTMGEALLATQLALAREQKLTDLGGVVAAAAHELGTPLATIKLVSSELMEELEGDQAEDAALIRQQADRCRDILRSMGRAGKDDLHLKRAPFETVVSEAAEPHSNRGKMIEILAEPDAPDEAQPLIWRRPEVIHGLRNLIQNAVDFADSDVQVALSWSADEMRVRISDDGAGFPPQLIGRIGDPFVSRRRDRDDRAQRPGYEGMGLGLFIAKTLLERTGARLSFANGGRAPRGGAIVRVVWPRAALEPSTSPGALGENRPFVA
ncbi:sensor histidine kinase RegB [Histidinibacterium aquaticum]|uniref:histidine kinase n=1 Tax=Histidinibacterium aquaticum TaxID=2613962 RepID=A0A5J5GFA6_9RHOB|nr:ActS/PrrB/RegB family redox-sensitive histidine kinase [Histidinibacterium aquaticum]KAA9006801.1 ActS/PrrB/RegB family redox-sensitive histidine kinase [Histidinibacterium aquaticum]